jgi:hypothetical protein
MGWNANSSPRGVVRSPAPLPLTAAWCAAVCDHLVPAFDYLEALLPALDAAGIVWMGRLDAVLTRPGQR